MYFYNTCLWYCVLNSVSLRPLYIQHNFWVMARLAGYKLKCGFNHPTLGKPQSLQWDLSEYYDHLYFELYIIITIIWSWTTWTGYSVQRVTLAYNADKILVCSNNNKKNVGSGWLHPILWIRWLYRSYRRNWVTYKPWRIQQKMYSNLYLRDWRKFCGIHLCGS